MSKYTTEVRYICETYAGYDESQGYSDIKTVIDNSRDKVFDFDFPMFDENYRSVLETKILKHYYTREIGLETVSLWKHWLDMRLNEIMPYYNQLYKSETLEFNPFYDFDYTTTSNRGIKHDEKTGNIRTDNLNEATSSSTTRTDNLAQSSSSERKGTNQNTRTDNLAHEDHTTNSSDQMDAYSDTPQGSLSGVSSENYLTSARHITNSGHEDNNGTNTGTVTNSGNDSETQTGNVSNTGTQKNDGTGNRTNTGTQSNDGTRNYTNTDEYLEHVAGKRNGTSYAELLKEYRSTFLNIDMMVINDLADLFMNVW